MTDESRQVRRARARADDKSVRADLVRRMRVALGTHAKKHERQSTQLIREALEAWETESLEKIRSGNFAAQIAEWRDLYPLDKRTNEDLVWVLSDALHRRIRAVSQ